MASLPFKSPYSRQIALWVLRAFSPALARKRFFRREGYADGDIAEFLGLPEEVDESEISSICRQLDNMLSALENCPQAIGLPSHVEEIFSKLGETFRLNPTERRILQFLACSQTESVLVDTHTQVANFISIDPARFYSKLLELSRAAVAKALSPNSKLMNCGLLKSCGGNSKSFVFISSSVAYQLFSRRFDLKKVLRQFGDFPPPAALGIGDYPQLRPALDLIIPYLSTSLPRKKGGINILLYGPPGTGKTQLTRVIAKAVGIPVFELASEDADGEPISPVARLNAIQAAHSIFHDTPTLLVFDEAEDIFSPFSQHSRSAAHANKGWFNKMLESHHLPVVWISNSIDELDPAFARRFDFILEVPIPPRKQRRKMLGAMVGNLISPTLIDQLTESEHISPAVIARTHDVIRNIGKSLPKSERSAAFSRILGNTLKAQGHPDPTKATIQVIQPGLYDITHLNTTADLRMIAGQLVQSPSARLCLYGPPGTGKTSFGHWLAHEISQPLLVRKASELLDPYLGMTERKIARTFAQATEDGAVLLIDEVDSFLQDRTRAKRSWEVTQVNEMLTQIESFPGILIASTNLVDHLDQASIRRFDIKIHFGYLLPEQTVRLLVSHCRNLNIPAPTPDDLALATTLDTATPGDFAAVARQHKFQPFRSAVELLQAVIQELGYKNNSLRRIGFQ